jgi:outer membrane protein OmpA-like peptidoglycan-associated protein
LTFSAQTTFKYRLISDTSFEVGDKIIAPAILYGLSGDACTYQPFKDSVVKISIFLEAHPKLIIELAGHTDSRGDKSSLFELSTARMNCIKNYLVRDLGIDSSRIKTRGYGCSQPIVSDNIIASKKTQEEKEELFAKNRRTEIIILGTK